MKIECTKEEWSLLEFMLYHRGDLMSDTIYNLDSFTYELSKFDGEIVLKIEGKFESKNETND